METGGKIVPISESLLALLSKSGDGLMPFSREIFLLDIVVAGTTHCKNIRELAPQITEGTVLRLLRDPDNQYDAAAIGVFLDKERIGWVPRELNLMVSRLMDAGKAFVCRVSRTEWRNKWYRIDAKLSMCE